MQKASMRMSTIDVNYVILIAEQKINRYLYTNVYISFYCAIQYMKLNKGTIMQSRGLRYETYSLS